MGATCHGGSSRRAANRILLCVRIMRLPTERDYTLGRLKEQIGDERLENVLDDPVREQLIQNAENRFSLFSG